MTVKILNISLASSVLSDISRKNTRLLFQSLHMISLEVAKTFFPSDAETIRNGMMEAHDRGVPVTKSVVKCINVPYGHLEIVESLILSCGLHLQLHSM